MQYSQEETSWLFNVLKNLSFLNGCSAADIDFLIRNLRKKSFGKNKTIFKQGDKGDCLYILYKGQLGIWVKTGLFSKKQIATLDPGTYVGEYSLLMGEKKTATGITLTPCEFFIIERDNFYSLVDNNLAIRNSVKDVIEQRRVDRKEELIRAHNESIWTKLGKYTG